MYKFAVPSCSILALDRHLAFERHAERSEKSDSGCKVVDDHADVVQSLDRHVLVSPRPCAVVQADRSREFPSPQEAEWN